jgi:hypothetical protein
VESWDFVIQELGIGYTGTGIYILDFAVKHRYYIIFFTILFYDKKVQEIL